jgi:hypothetical protein
VVHTSGHETVAGLIDYVNRRLGQNSPIVKQKVILTTPQSPPAWRTFGMHSFPIGHA